MAHYSWPDYGQDIGSIAAGRLGDQLRDAGLGAYSSHDSTKAALAELLYGKRVLDAKTAGVRSVTDPAYGGAVAGDWTVATQAMVDAAGPWDQLLFPPPGPYNIAGPIDISAKDRIAFVGSHGTDSAPIASVIKHTGSGKLFSGYNAAFNRVSVSFKDLSIEGPGIAAGTVAIEVNSQRFVLDHCTITGFDRGLKQRAVASLVETRISNSILQTFGTSAVESESNATDGWLTNSVVADAGTVGVDIANVNGWHVSGNHFYGTPIHLRWSAGSQVRCQDNFFDDISAFGIVGTLDSIIESAILSGNVFTTAAENAILVQITASVNARLILALNQLFATSGTVNTTGLKILGAGTLYGQSVFNNFKNLTTKVSGAASSFEYIEFNGDQLLTQANELWLSSWSGSPTKFYSDGSGNGFCSGNFGVPSGKVLKVNAIQVVGPQGLAVADATDAATTMARLNDLLARLRAHGLIAT